MFEIKLYQHEGLAEIFCDLEAESLETEFVMTGHTYSIASFEDEGWINTKTNRILYLTIYAIIKSGQQWDGYYKDGPYDLENPDKWTNIQRIYNLFGKKHIIENHEDWASQIEKGLSLYDDETMGWVWEDFEEDWSDDLTMVRKIFDGELSSMQIVEWFFKQPLSQSI